MDDVIKIKDQFYVLATSSLTDSRTSVLKYGKTCGTFNRLGDIESVGLGEHGIYHEEMRHLSRFATRLRRGALQLLHSAVRQDNTFLTVDMMNVDIFQDGRLEIPRSTLHLFRSKFIRHDTCFEHIRISNYSLHPIATTLCIEFDADFVDIFEVRGTRRERRGSILPPRMEGGDQVIFSYEGLDDKLRLTRLAFSPVPSSLEPQSASFDIALDPKEETSIYVTVSCGTRAASRKVFSFSRALAEAGEEFEASRASRCRIFSSNIRFDSWLGRSEADLHMLTVGNPEGPYPYAGIPWFNTAFGRDGIITALQCLWFAPNIAQSVLRFLAETQATDIDPAQEAQPGKILHEMRRGEMAALKEVPFGRYYGSIDSTPLFLILAGAYLDRTHDVEFLRGIWPNILAALDWIDLYGDVDGDGFIEYKAQSSRGLIQQGWKDSHDSVFHPDGALAEPPIALCEVQGYVYAAKKAVAGIAAEFGQADLQQRLLRETEYLRERFERTFWVNDLQSYALALDGEKKPCCVKTSNAGQCLFTGIVSAERAKLLAKTLLSPDLFCGWGIRTLSSSEVRYNPMAYHNGSVWPHDNAMIARGLARYGLHQEALTIFRAIFDASGFMELNRLPELFCGFHRRGGAEGPTLYPVACSPQAWSAGAIYLFLEAALGIEIRGKDRCVRFSSSQLPDFLTELQLDNLRVMDTCLDITARRGKKVSIEVTRKIGSAKVEILT